MAKLLHKIEWSEDFSIGNCIMDSEHKALIGIINDLVQDINIRVKSGEFAEILSRMTDYSLNHFSNEEAYMQSINYPDTENHIKYHKEYVLKTALFNSLYLTINSPNDSDVVDFLHKWWVNHIMSEDKKYEIYKRESIYSEIKRRVLEISTDAARESGKRFFKEEVNIAGVKSADIGKLSKDLFKNLTDKDKKSVFILCEMLWRGNILEESFIACSWAYNMRKYFVEEDFYIFENWIERFVTNWASCDTFCNHTMGEIIDMYPHLTDNLMGWCKSENRWKRRAAAVSLIVPAREGRFMDEVFQIADLLLLDEDDMVRKGYGWLLKVCSNKHQEEVFDFVMKRKDVMPRTSLRYAIEKMPAQLKARAMKR